MADNEFERPGSVSLDDYVAGLKAELVSSDNPAAVKRELDRVLGNTKETAILEGAAKSAIASPVPKVVAPLTAPKSRRETA